MTSFNGWGWTASRLEPLWEGNTKFPEILGTHFINLREEWKAESTMEPPNDFDHETPGLGIQHLNH